MRRLDASRQVGRVENYQVASLITGAVAVTALAISLGAWRAMLRTGNRNILFVAAGFFLIAAKNVVKALHLLAAPESIGWEIAFSLVDLAAVALIVWPLVPVWRRDAS